VIPDIVPNRCITGASAVLLPFDEAGNIVHALLGFNILHTVNAHLIPAVNMDTGYTNLLTPEQRTSVLEVTSDALEGTPFIAGAFVEGLDGDPEKLYHDAVAEIESYGGTAILFQCNALKQMDRRAKVALYASVAEKSQGILAFELGEMFAPFGEIWDLDTFQGIMEIPNVQGLKHSSLSRRLEWERLALRDSIRPDFDIYTGNDLAIDMVMWGSDYLLGLSAFHPEAFAKRDACWVTGDPRFYELNDALQYLGAVAFRPPVPAYKHSCAQFLKLRRRLVCDAPHPNGLRRPDTDVPILQDILQRIEGAMAAEENHE